MYQVLQRIVYDATVDDACDVAWRMSNRSPAFRKQIRTTIVIAGIATALVVFVFFAFFENNRTPTMLVVIFGISAVCGVLGTALFRRQFTKEIFKQQRKVVADQFGGRPSIRSELELRSDAVWVRQAGMEMVFPWDVCTSVVDNANDVELNFAPGICVIRNKDFASPAERQQFLETARRLANPTNPTKPS
ncbi:MAG TPA: hypothetical protein VFO48_05285 [Vicinamibacterales bacterium]|nr:hypothetical protein [Vicinamibacterales bacterium]